MSVILTPPLHPPHAQATPACPCRVPGSMDPCQQLARLQKSEGSSRNCVNTFPLCLRGDPRASQSQFPHWPSVASLLCSRPVNGSLAPVVSPACFGLPSRAHLASLSSQHLWAGPLGTVGSFQLPRPLCSISRLWAFAQAVPSAPAPAWLTPFYPSNLSSTQTTFCPSPGMPP